jgi:hypothetical protein
VKRTIQALQTAEIGEILRACVDKTLILDISDNDALLNTNNPTAQMKGAEYGV